VSDPVVEVNEASIWASGQGADWWNLWRSRMEAAGRITIKAASIGGDRVHVACADRTEASEIRDMLTDAGVHKSAVKVRMVRND
jgi:hypothetical protein